MSDAKLRLAADRANREAAHAVFAERLARIKGDLEVRSVGARVADSVKEGTSEAIDAGIGAAKERKGLVAGTIGALLLWLFRHPLFDAAASLAARIRGDDDEEDETGDESE